MKYSLSTDLREQHYLKITFTTKVAEDKTVLQLPAWRPGRYELGNFAKNIREFSVKDENGTPLLFSKKTKDQWVVDTKKSKEIKVEYTYYSIDFNAGSTYLDEKVLYVNPVNCFLYIPSRMEEKCTVEIPKEKEEKIACGVPFRSGKITVKDFHELADTPFVVSSALQSKSYESKGIKFTIWFYGECKPDWKKVVGDFKKFTDYQLKLFGGFPSKEFHFINLIHPFKAYHGVEHSTSTIISFGPSYDLMGTLYPDFLGVSSHELYHAWNIKSIRPTEMKPYDYSKENYSKLGYVAEGVTTYMGDLILFESKVFDRKQYCIEVNNYLKRHYGNGGRLNLSVADSSFDTWLDGYVAGAPDRKSSIYVEGLLVSFMIDSKIKKATEGKKSLHDVMRLMYKLFGKTGIGYTEKDYKYLIEEVSGVSFTSFFKNYIWGTKEFTNELKKWFAYAGYKFSKTASKVSSERFGLQISSTNKETKVVNVMEDSPAFSAGLSRGDKLVEINQLPVNKNFNEWMEYFENELIELTYVRNGKSNKTSISKSNNNQFWEYKIS